MLNALVEHMLHSALGNIPEVIMQIMEVKDPRDISSQRLHRRPAVLVV